MKSILDCCGEVSPNAELKNYVTMGVGGRCKFLCFPKNIKEVKRLVLFCNKTNTKYFILGNGSNVIPKDEFYDGVVICLKKLLGIKQKQNKLTILAGENLFKVNHYCIENCLGGLEWSYGIPASIGGAVCMNAGAYGEDMSKVVESCKILSNGKIITLNNSKLDFSYRNSLIKKNKYIVLSCTLKLQTKDKQLIKQQCEDNYKKRKQSQPLAQKNSGCIFKQTNGVIAGKTIDNLGLKGVKIGGAEISKIHANFIVNSGDAKASDVFKLMEFIQDRVYNETGVLLESEIVKLGDD